MPDARGLTKSSLFFRKEDVAVSSEFHVPPLTSRFFEQQ